MTGGASVSTSWIMAASKSASWTGFETEIESWLESCPMLSPGQPACRNTTILGVGLNVRILSARVSSPLRCSSSRINENGRALSFACCIQAHAIAPVWAKVGSRFQRSSILASVSDVSELSSAISTRAPSSPVGTGGVSEGPIAGSNLPEP